MSKKNKGGGGDAFVFLLFVGLAVWLYWMAGQK